MFNKYKTHRNSASLKSFRMMTGGSRWILVHHWLWNSDSWWAPPVCPLPLVLDLGGRADIFCSHGREPHTFPLSTDTSPHKYPMGERIEWQVHYWVGTREKVQWPKAKFTLLCIWRNTGPPNVMEDMENRDKDVRVLSFLAWRDVHNISLN